jgi:hypothetical protein
MEAIDSLEIVDPVGTPDGSRFVLLPAGHPLQLPACSLFNRSSNEPWMLETGIDNDEGVVYIGKSDFHEMARVVGYVPESHIENLRRENGRLTGDLIVAIDTINSLRNAIADLVGSTTAFSIRDFTEEERTDEDRKGKRREAPTIVDFDTSD